MWAWGVSVAILAGLLAPILGGCAADVKDPILPEPDAGFDYQLGGAYQEPTGVTLVVRDRLEEPAGAGYDVCYVNGFQTQPGGAQEFLDADLVVHVDGEPLTDPDWPDELILDTSSARSRQAISAIVGEWITGCAASGYDAVEIDNLDSYTRSEGRMRAEDNFALAAEFARTAHGAGLAIAQKNTAEHAKRLRALGYDFAIAESCRQFDECTMYTDVYPAVFDIEYDDELGVEAFERACREPQHPTMILRDHDLRTPADADYVYADCPHPF